MVSFHDDGPTSIYKKSGGIPEYYDVTVLKTAPNDKLAHIESIIYQRCKIHFLKRNDYVEVRKKCKEPITIFASSPDSYYASINEANDHPNYFIGVIFKKDDSKCYPLIRGMANFMRLILCYPYFTRQLSLTPNEHQALEYNISDKMRDELLNIFKLSPITTDELHQTLTMVKTYSPLTLEDAIM